MDILSVISVMRARITSSQVEMGNVGLYVPPPEMTREQWEREVPPEAVILRLRDGRVFIQEVRTPKGRPGSPMTRQEKETKYRDCASLALPPQYVEDSLSILLRLEGLDDIAKLMNIVCFPETCIHRPS